MTLPTLTEEQRKDALAKAKRARTARAVMLEEVRAGQRTAAQVLAAGKEGDPVAAKMKVVTLLRALPGFGKGSAEKLVAELGIMERRRLGGLGKNQAARLLERLGQ